MRGLPIIGINMLTCNHRAMPEMFQFTQHAVESLLDSDLQDYPFNFVVVDNGSNDHTITWLGERPEVHVIPLGENKGISKARNIGYRWLIEQARPPDYFLEVHNDHFFPSKWLKPLMTSMATDHKIGIVSPGLITNHGYFGSPIYRLQPSKPYHRLRLEIDIQAARCCRPNLIKPGLQHPCLKRVDIALDLAYRSDNGRLDFYDEQMEGSNWEDLEEACRYHEAGWKVVVNRGSVVYHYYAKSRVEIAGADFDRFYYANAQRFYELHPDGHPFVHMFSLWMDPNHDGVYARRRQR